MATVSSINFLFFTSLCIVFLMVNSSDIKNTCASLEKKLSRDFPYRNGNGATLAKNRNGFFLEDNDEGSPQIDFSDCVVQTGAGTKQMINLQPLARKDGIPRYNASFNVSSIQYPGQWNYAYNPCVSYNLPYDPFAKESLGDGCQSVSLCKYQKQFYYPLGVHSPAKTYVCEEEQDQSTPRTFLIYTGVKSAKVYKTKIELVCDPSYPLGTNGVFQIVYDSHMPGVDTIEYIRAELRHQCCCAGACIEGAAGIKGPGADSEFMLVIVGTMVALILMVALVGGLCYVKRTHLQIYSKLPGVHAANGVVGGPQANGMVPTGKSCDFRDYEPHSVVNARRKLLPVLPDSMISKDSVEMGQRLGGGIFGDTHIARWNEMSVTVKRLTLSIHVNQLTSEAMELMKEEVWFLSRQRHKNIVCVLGLCLDGRLPFVLTEYVIGECLKDYLNVNGSALTWPQRIRICSQISDGMAFLHSTKPPIIHRDLRCGNLFLSDNDMVKVADFSLIKLLQPMRNQCDSDDCSCQRQWSGCPAITRWTAPELLLHPRSREGEGTIISTALDVYSFAMIMWEMVFYRDPFDEISTEAEVVEIVKNGGRPEVPPSVDMMPLYKDVMKSCWDQRPSVRPQFKNLAVRLKESVGAARVHQKSINHKQNRQHKLSHSEPV